MILDLKLDLFTHQVTKDYRNFHGLHLAEQPRVEPYPQRVGGRGRTGVATVLPAPRKALVSCDACLVNGLTAMQFACSSTVQGLPRARRAVSEANNGKPLSKCSRPAAGRPRCRLAEAGAREPPPSFADEKGVCHSLIQDSGAPACSAWRRAISRRSQLVVRSVRKQCANRSRLRLATEHPTPRGPASDLGSEELDRAHRLCMINMGDVHFETINLHQLVEPDDLGRNGLWIAEEQCAFGPDQILDRLIGHRWPASLPADFGECLTVGRQELRPCRGLVGEDIAVAVDRKRRAGVVF